MHMHLCVSRMGYYHTKNVCIGANKRFDLSEIFKLLQIKLHHKHDIYAVQAFWKVGWI